jgi:hypothetical protein
MSRTPSRYDDDERSEELAEREGFEPSIPLPVWQFSRLLASTTCVPLREWQDGDFNLISAAMLTAGRSCR